LPGADVVVLAAPLSGKAGRLIGATQFKAMKKSAVLINVAQGGLVDADALAAALRSKRIAGVGLDVTDPEPPDGSPLPNQPNVIVTPRLGGASPQARERQWRLWKENVRRFVAGEPLLCVVGD
jgi:phosphoglycerate dehydrogenase-like enzyme